MKAPRTDRTAQQGVSIVSNKFAGLGFAFRSQFESDYGIDAHAELIQLGDQPTGQLLGIQINSGDSYLSERTENAIVFRVDADHVRYWIEHALPVIICLCDVDNEVVYWESVTEETAVSTGKRFRFDIPYSQELDTDAVPALTELLTPLVPSTRYTISKTKDTSHGIAKRYAIEVLINGTASKSEVAAIVRAVTKEGAKRHYHRDEIARETWEDTDAHVVSTFIFASAEDHARWNFICHSLWINNCLEDHARPMALERRKYRRGHGGGME